MAESLVRNESPAAYFKELVESALQRQRLQASELTSFYIVNLLTTFVHRDNGLCGRADAEPLALQLARAMESEGSVRREALRSVGDLSLFVAGFFSDSLNRKLVDIDYYVMLGGRAYESLSHLERETLAPAFAELAGSFLSFVDVLNDVSEQCTVTTNADVLRLYEKWLRTGSRRDGQRLVERGIVPNASIGSRFVQ
ncbi:MAG TPA: hypothetical protein VH702_02670 [Vicinamibacterales bacterium]|jgi:hypothetical protein